MKDDPIAIYGLLCIPVAGVLLLLFAYFDLDGAHFLIWGSIILTFAAVIIVLLRGGIEHHIARRGNVEEMSKLLDDGGRPNRTTIFGTSPLHVAARHNNLAIVQLLIEAGADTGSRDVFGRTALDVAMKHKNDPVAAVLRGA